MSKIQVGGGLWSYSVRNPRVFKEGVGHTGVIRAAVTLYDGSIVTGAEDSSIMVWREQVNQEIPQPHTEESKEPKNLSSSRQDRYYRPF